MIGGRERAPTEAWRRLAYAVASGLAAALLFLLGARLMIESLERQLIYFPARAAEDLPTPRVAGASWVEEVWLETADSVRIHGLYAGAPDAFGDVLFFHGNAGNLYDRLGNVEDLVRSGFNVLILDYRGYGKSGGQPSEAGLYRDADSAYRYLTVERSIPAERLVTFGRSLGSAVAVDLAVSRDVAALVVEAGFTHARDLADVHYGWLPNMLLRAMTHEFDSLSKVRGLRAPALFIHGEQDRIVPPSMGRRLFEAAPEPKEWYLVRGAGHNDTWLVGGDGYHRRLTAFAKRHVATRHE